MQPPWTEPHCCSFTSLCHSCPPLHAVSSTKTQTGVSPWNNTFQRILKLCSFYMMSPNVQRCLALRLELGHFSLRLSWLSLYISCFSSDKSERCGRIHLSARPTVPFSSSISHSNSPSFLAEGQHWGLVEVMVSGVRMPGWEPWLLLHASCVTWDKLPLYLSLLSWKMEMRMILPSQDCWFNLLRALKAKSP